MSELDDDDRTVTGITVQGQLDQTTPYLVVMASPNATGRMFRLDRDNLVIGRGHDADIHLEELGISRYHARIHLRGDRVEVVDLGSKNGTFHEGERVQRAELGDGEKFQLGPTTVLKVSYQDVLEERLRQNLYEAATRDALTGLYNQKYFTDVLDRELVLCDARGVPLSVAVMDLDHFKAVNDRFGHPAGDRLLAGVARVLSSCVPHDQVLARLGGEEFGLLLRGYDLQRAASLVEHMRREVSLLRVPADDDEIHVTLSAGVATVPPGATSRSNALLIQEADRNLYRAKEHGRNRVCT